MTSKFPINLADLLRQRTVEGECIDYKAGWNPCAIARIPGITAKPSNRVPLTELLVYH